MKNWVRNGSWKRITRPKFSSHGQQVRIASDEDIVFIGAGNGGICSGGYRSAVRGEWPEGNPEGYWAIKWDKAPTQGEAQYISRGSNRFTWFENLGTRSAGVLAAKRVTLSYWLRSPGGCTVIPVIFRGRLNLQAADRFPFSEISMQLWSGETQQVGPGNTPVKVNMTLDLPQIPDGVVVGPNSCLGVGLDFPDLFGPEIHVGPYALYEIAQGEQDVQPIEEVPYWEEISRCLADEFIAAKPGFFRK